MSEVAAGSAHSIQGLARDCELMIRAGYGAVLIDTPEEERAAAIVQQVAWNMQVPLYAWRRGTGLSRVGTPPPVFETEDPCAALRNVIDSSFTALYLFYGLRSSLEGRPEIIDLVREAASRLSGRPGALIFTAEATELADSLGSCMGVVQVPAPTREDYQEVLRQVIGRASNRMKVDVCLSSEEQERLLVNLRGLSLSEAEKLLTLGIVRDGRLDTNDILQVAQAKRKLIERGHLLEYFPASQSLNDIAGLSRLKDWLEKRRMLIENPARGREFGLEFPRGVLLVGVPGCGKSLCAKAVAAAWGLPLVRLDPGSLYSKYTGESERNVRRAIRTADRLAPMVLWIDEIEKAFAVGSEDDGGTSRRVLGTFTTWLQERSSETFIVATANDAGRLPAELVRKGRFDEIFFVDLPDEITRSGIFTLHLTKRRQDPARFDLALLAKASAGYSGADIEQVIVSALYDAFAADTRLSTDSLIAKLRQTPPIALMAKERIASVRAWAQGRAVPAN